MSKVISRSGLALLLGATLVAAMLYVVFNNAFGGPQVRTSSPYQLQAVLSDTQALLKKSFVLLRGVNAGSVERVEVRDGRAHVTFSVRDRYAPVYRDATIRLGNRSLLGEPFIELDPGNPRAGAMPNHGTLAPRQVLDNVEFDEALQALDEPSLGSLRAASGELARAVRSPAASERIGAASAAFGQVVGEARELTALLRGQRGDIAGLVDDTGRVLEQLGSRQQRIRRIVADGRLTLDALGGRGTALRAGLREAPRLLDQVRGTLLRARPLLREARPLIARTRAVAPRIAPLFDDLEPVVRDGAIVLEGLPDISHAALPTLSALRPVARDARPVAQQLVPALRNLIPTLRHLADRTPDMTGFIATLADSVADGDSRGVYARVASVLLPGTVLSLPEAESKLFGQNPYPEPGHAQNPTSFRGEYPRLLPTKP